MSQEELIDKLVKDMGFNRAEATMALNDASGNMERAVDKLLNGDYAPPPYTPTNEPASTEPLCTGGQMNTASEQKPPVEGGAYPSVRNFLSELTGRSTRPVFDEENPTAPPLVVDLPDIDDNRRSTALNEPQLPHQLHTLPPPYEILQKETKMKSWEEEMSIEFAERDFVNYTASESERCAVCFSAILSPDGSTRRREDIMCHKGQIFHQACFTKKHGPKCSHCCFPLTQASKDHDLSGHYLVYKNKDYHVECYERFAGPRCSYCFNVIIERPKGEFSGQYVIDGHREFHLECMQKKLHSTWLAKNS